MTKAIDVIRGHTGIGGHMHGVVLSARDGFSARYDLDRAKGIFSRPVHKLYNQSYVDKILELDIAKGGVASAWMLNQMVEMGKAPKAILLNFVNPVIAQGAALAGIALMDRFGCDITQALRSGDEVEVDPMAGNVRILQRVGA